MKSKRLYLRLDEPALQSAAVRYHFEGRKELFFRVYEDLARRIEPFAFYEYNFPKQLWMTAVTSLGPQPDEMMEAFQRKELFSEAYAVDCLSLELLTQSYRAVREFVFREQRCYLGEMLFCSEEELGFLFPVLKERWKNLPVQITEAGALLPSKTTVFQASYGLRGGTCRNSCENCPNNRDCGFRDLR